MDTFSQIQTLKWIAALAIAFFSYRKLRICQRNLEHSDDEISDTFSSHSEQQVKESKESKEESESVEKEQNEKDKKISIEAEDHTNEGVDLEDLFRRRDTASNKGTLSKSRKIEKEKSRKQKETKSKIRQAMRIKRGPRNANKVRIDINYGI